MVEKGKLGPKGKGTARKIPAQKPPPKPTNEDAGVESDGESASIAKTSEPPEIAMETCTQANNKKANVVTNLTDEQEEVMIEWLTEHPEVYNKKLNKYKDIISKTALWETKARELDLDCKYHLKISSP